MYIRRDDASSIIEELKGRILDGFDEVHRFFDKLFDDDDWSLVIKSHAFVESIITEMLVAQTRQEPLRKIIERLPLHDDQIGKLKIAKSYGLISREQRGFLLKLSEMRNRLVHGAANLNFDFQKYLNTLSKEERKSWTQAITWFSGEEASKESWLEIVERHPRIGIWFGAFMFAQLSSLRATELLYEQRFDKAALEATRKIAAIIEAEAGDSAE